MKKFKQSIYSSRVLPVLAGACLASGISSAALAQGVDFVFVVDESGSMSGEHAFIPTLVNDLNGVFSAAGFTDNRFALVGFGDGNVVPRLVTGLGSVADVVAGASTLTVTGGTEDGYAGIDFSFANFTLRPDSAQFLLITDEDRDDTDGNLTFNSILGQFVTNNAGLNGIYDIQTISIVPGATPPESSDPANLATYNGQVLAVDTLNNKVYVVDSHTPGGFRAINLPGAITPIVGAFGTTQADYIDLGEQTVGGCVASIDQLRTNVPVVVGAFAGALVDCLTFVVVNNPGSFQARTQVVLKNFFGTAQFSQIVNSYPGLTIASQNPYNRRQASRAGGLNFALLPGSTAGAASGATADYVSPDGTYSLYGSFAFDWGSYDRTPTTIGSSFTSQSVSVGGDAAVAANTYLGASFAFTNMKNELSNDTDEQKVNAYNLYLYAVYAEAAAHFEVIANAGLLNQDTTRVAGADTLTGTTDGWVWGGQISGGYDFALTDSIKLGPVGSLRYTKLTFDSYSETGGAGAAAIGEQEFDALVVSLGLQTGFAIPVTDTETFNLRLRGAWEHDLMDGPEPVTVGQVGGGATFSVSPDEADDDWFAVGAGFTVDGAGYSFYGDFDTRLAYDDADLYFGRFGLKIYF